MALPSVSPQRQTSALDAAAKFGVDAAAMRLADKRFALVGHRKGGYCGHTPQFVAFKLLAEQQAQQAAAAAVASTVTGPSHTPGPTDRGAPASAQGSRIPALAPSTTPGPTPDAHDRRASSSLLHTQPQSSSPTRGMPPVGTTTPNKFFYPPDFYRGAERPMHPFSPPKNPAPPDKIVGFAGHRSGFNFTTGAAPNSKRKTELLPVALEQQLVHPEFGKPEPLPPYPVIRGPSRPYALGHQCFLTN